MQLLKPPLLPPHATLGIVTPSSPLPALAPARYERGLRALEAMGYKVVEGRTARTRSGYLSADPEARAADINEMFRSPDIDAIVCSIGGYHYNQLLPWIDFEAVREHPKILLGYSDATVLQLACYTACGLVTFSGPAVMTQFAEYPEIDAYTLAAFKRALGSADPIGAISPAAEWTDEFLDWFTGADAERRRTYRPNPGWRWATQGHASGPLVGGCLPSMLHLAGTRFWPDFAGAILLLDIPEGQGLGKGFDLQAVDMCLADLRNLGVFECVSGVVLGRGYGYTHEEHEELHYIFSRYAADVTGPCLTGVDYGHSDPLLTLPIGVAATIDSERNLFSIDEGGVSPS